MKHANPETGKSVVVDIESNIEEINETYNALRKEELPLGNRIFLWKANVYKIDPMLNKPKVRTHLSRGEGTKNLDETKKKKTLIALEY